MDAIEMELQLDAFKAYVKALDAHHQPEVFRQSYADNSVTLLVHVYACVGRHRGDNSATGVCRYSIVHENEDETGEGWSYPMWLQDFIEQCENESSPLHRWILPSIVQRVDELEETHAELRRIAARENE